MDTEKLTLASELLAKASALLDDAGWPGLAQEVMAHADAADAAAS